MLIAFAITCVAVLLPCLLVFKGLKSLQQHPFFYVPILVCAYFFAFCACSAIAYRLHLYGFPKFIGVIVTASLLTYCFGRFLLPRLNAKRVDESPIRFLILTLGLAVFSVLPDIAVFSFQRWDLTGNRSFFSVPFAGDIQRHTNIIDAIIHHNSGFFLPKSNLIYQILWHHGGATVLNILPPAFTNYYHALGFILFTGLLFYFTLYWLILLLCPTILKQPLLLLAIALLVSADADLFSAGMSLIQTGKLGIAADGSYSIPSLQYFSIKLLTLTAPQHTIFFVFLNIFLGVTLQGETFKLSTSPESLSPLPIRFDFNSPFYIPFLIPPLFFNPILSILFFTTFFAIEILKKVSLILFQTSQVSWVRFVSPQPLKPEILRSLQSNLASLGKLLLLIILSLAGTYVLHQVLLGFSWLDLLSRPNAGGQIGFGLPWGPQYAFVPVLPMLSTGVVGTLFSILVLKALSQKRWNILWDSLYLSIVVGFLFWYFVIIQNELKRHFAMVAVYLIVLLTAKLLSSNWTHGSTRILVAIALIPTLVLGGYQGWSYAARGNAIDPSIPWGDYFCINQKIRTIPDLADLAVVAASGSVIPLPVVNEVVPALVDRTAVFAHHKVSAEQFKILNSLTSPEELLFREQLVELGFNSIIWGPVEDKVWGPTVKRNLIWSRTPLLTCGQVALYSFASIGKELQEQGTALIHPSTHSPQGTPNLALQGSVRQSSTLEGGEARKAIDGRMDTLSHTTLEVFPWIEIDLGKRASIRGIQVWNRLDCCAERLNSLLVAISDQPFQDVYPNQLSQQPTVSTYFVAEPIKKSLVIPIDRAARYIRLELIKKEYLSLSEIQIWGTGDGQ